jgi:hypothetical protein
VRTSPGTVKFYIFAGDTLIGEHTGATASVAYTWGADGLVSQQTLSGTPTTLWHHYGPQGETGQLTDSTGTVTDPYLYNAYGKQLASTGSNTTPHRYGGKYGYYNDGGVGLMLAQ